MAGIQRLTRQVAEVLKVLYKASISSSDPDEQKMHGYRLMEITGLSGPSVYRILDRLEDMGFVTAWWEPLEEDRPPPKARPRRRYYILNRSGFPLAEEARLRYPNEQEEPQRTGLSPEPSRRPRPGFGTLILGLTGLAERPG